MLHFNGEYVVKRLKSLENVDPCNQHFAKHSPCCSANKNLMHTEYAEYKEHAYMDWILWITIMCAD